jgi:endonuclease/exonuclease/phosphatase family metal-dependent hydrolase
MRAKRRQPDIVVLQEAFTPEAKRIAGLSGYPYIVEGAYTRAAPGAAERGTRNWFLGETQPAMVDSGLIILSDLPVLAVSRASFPPTACAGWDCLAAKGIAMVTVDVPGKGPLTVATVHLNCQGASGASKPRATQAYVRQVGFLARYLSAERHPGAPLIIAGDFNRGHRPQRIAALKAALTRVAGSGAPTDALTRALGRPGVWQGQDPDLRFIQARARDLQYAFAGDELDAVPVAADVPFGTEIDGSMLSDHMGYTVHYRLRSASPPLRIAGSASAAGRSLQASEKHPI